MEITGKQSDEMVRDLTEINNALDAELISTLDRTKAIKGMLMRVEYTLDVLAMIATQARPGPSESVQEQSKRQPGQAPGRPIEGSPGRDLR